MGIAWDLHLTIPETSDPALILNVQVVRAAEIEYGIEFLHVKVQMRTQLRLFIWKHISRSTLKGGPPLFALVDHSNPRWPGLQSLP